MDRKQLVFEACKFIYNDSESDRLKKCKVLGRTLNNAVPADVLDYLIDYAEKQPRKIIELYTGEDWKLQLFLIDAIDRGVIRKVDGVYKYEEKFLGATQDATVLLLKDPKYKKLVDSIKKETYPEFDPVVKENEN